MRLTPRNWMWVLVALWVSLWGWAQTRISFTPTLGHPFPASETRP